MKRLTSAACLFWAAAAAAVAQPYVYPAHGQSSKRQARDEAECSKWASQQSGFDPARPPPAPVTPDTKVTGSGARVAGAAGGAIIGGASGGNAGTGALVGAGVGGLVRRARGHAEANRQNEANAQAYEAARANWDRARTACLTGRGYTIR